MYYNRAGICSEIPKSSAPLVLLYLIYYLPLVIVVIFVFNYMCYNCLSNDVAHSPLQAFHYKSYITHTPCPTTKCSLMYVGKVGCLDCVIK